MINLFRSLVNPLQLAGILTINDLYTELDETIANKLIIIGDQVRFIRLPHTKFMFDSLVTFAFLSAFVAEDGRHVTLLPHWGERIDGDITATFQLIIGQNGATIIGDKVNEKWHILEGNVVLSLEELSSSTELLDTSSSNSSSTSEINKTSSSSTETASTSSGSSSSTVSESTAASHTSSSSTIGLETSSSSSTEVLETSSSLSSSSTEQLETSSSSVEFSSFTSSSSNSSSSSSTFESLTSSSTTSQSSC